jgi:hypothetical protein
VRAYQAQQPSAQRQMDFAATEQERIEASRRAAEERMRRNG